MEKLLFKFEIKKLLSQMSTKVIALILIIFPVIIVFGIISPSEQFSITMDDFQSASDFSNAILGFLNSLGFYYIILVVLASSILSREIESKYLYFSLSVVPNGIKLFFYKALSVSIVFTSMIALSSIAGYVAYSLLYLGEFSISLQIIGILSWGVLISFLISMIYMMILVICNILTDGSIFASLTVAISTVILLIIAGAINGVMFYLPAWVLDFVSTRNNILLLILYGLILIVTSYMMYLCAKKLRV
jgi:hypothetical protein